jgi:N,N-dimethylformamidase
MSVTRKMLEIQKDTAPIGPELIGYTNRFSVAPGERMLFMVSAEVDSAEARLVRLIHGDERSTVGLVEREVASSLDGLWPLERHVVYPGSFGLIESSDAIMSAAAHRLSGHLFLMPTLIKSTVPQGVLAQVRADGRAAWEIVVENGGDLVLRLFDGDGDTDSSARLTGVLRDRIWHSVSFTIDRSRGRLHLWSTALEGLAAGVTLHAEGTIHGRNHSECHGDLLLAARRLIVGPTEPRAADTFNGKLERPTLFAGSVDAAAAARLAAGTEPERIAAAVLLDLDLGAQAHGWQVRDRSPFNHVGRLYNAPLRNCTSHSWHGDVLAPALAPDAYAAVHFHDDDVHHANWPPTREWLVPQNLPSGLYALRLRSDGVEDRIPFIVRPPRDRATQAVALWLPSFSYAAYANTKRCLLGTAYGEFQPESSAGDALLQRHPEWGGSTYDVHSDGSGVAISSLARPVPNLRPTHRVGLVNAPRHLAADLYLIHWLEHLHVAVDVIGDEDVHAQGYELLRRYTTVITGGHPEYVSGRELSAVEEYTNSGGRLMYLGGNGFYWVTGTAPETSTTVEVRRGQAGTRTWTSAPGEHHHQFSGEPGGLWRYRGRPPHALTGIGFVAEGWDGKNRPYYRRKDSFKPEAAWAFEGIGCDEPIGEGGLIMGGAAGDELDTINDALGTPAETLVLASSSGHSDAYWLVVEDMLEGCQGVSGTQDSRIRADVTLTPKREAGAVFAVGSISWSGSLSYRAYDNPLARLTENVLRAFASGATPWLRGARGESGRSDSSIE